jgi:hypothetical protein
MKTTELQYIIVADPAAPRESDSWTLEPLTDEPARAPGEHVTLDARNIDPWSRTHAK